MQKDVKKDKTGIVIDVTSLNVKNVIKFTEIKTILYTSTNKSKSFKS